MILTKQFRFEASHILPKHPGKCSRLHGHSWVLEVQVEGTVNPSTGFVQDYAEISEKVKPLVEALDHRHLGQWIPEPYMKCTPIPYKQVWTVDNLPLDFYPSSENLLLWIGGQLRDIYQLNWSAISLYETCTSSAVLSRKEFENGCVSKTAKV